jgi:hypothetical protein
MELFFRRRFFRVVGTKSGAVTRKEFAVDGHTVRSSYGIHPGTWQRAQHIFSKRSVISPDRGLGILLVPGSLYRSWKRNNFYYFGWQE